MTTDGWLRLGIALGVGLLIGLQRQRARASLGGIRTFPIVALSGALSAMLAETYGPWLLILTGAGLITFAVLSEYPGHARAEEPAGMTTEAAMLLVFLLGAWLPKGPLAPVIVIAGVLLVLLQAKPELHDWTARLRDEDVRSLAQFVLVSCVILPILPDQSYGPFLALNPREIWLMVVLIVGVSLLGYVAQKLFTERLGTIATGIVGGLVSSTATTASFARASKESRDGVAASALVVVLASTVVYVRLGIALSVAAPTFSEIRWPLGALFAASLLSCGIAYLSGRRDRTTEQAPAAKPGDLTTALIFATLYATITLGTAAADHYFGSAGLYVASAISGLTDLDAISLATARHVSSGMLDGDEAAPLIVLAIISNLVFKIGIIAALGGRSLLGRGGALLGANVIAGVVVLTVLLLG